MHFTDSCMIFYPNAKGYTFYSTMYGSSSHIDHMLGHKANLNNSRKILIIPYILSDHYAIKLKINSKQKPDKLMDVEPLITE